jgi:hypothetical protein
MDCKTARLLLEVAHPLATELEASDKEQLAAHLAECPECGGWAEAERLADEQLGAAMRDVPVPQGLELRLLGRLHKERDAWYRAWLVRAAGLLLVLGLGAGIGYAVWFNRKPAPDLPKFLEEVTDQRLKSSPEQVEEMFKARGVPMVAPPQFDYRQLHSVGMADFQGKQVPYLVFFYNGGPNPPSALATVYVLSDRQFNLDDLRNRKPAFPGSGQNIWVDTHPNDQHVVYVVTYTCMQRDFRRLFLKAAQA